MNAGKNEPVQKPDPKQGSSSATPTPSGTGTEAERKGGVEPAKRQAERDWEDSAKESGD
jgi:hypothetical protein